jgi:methionyl-tRNA formyltransferase
MLKVHRMDVAPGQASGTPGEVMRADAGGFWVSTGAGIVSLEEVQLENKKRVGGVEFLRGARIQVGDRLG